MLTETEKYRRCYENPAYKCGTARLEVGHRFVDSLLGHPRATGRPYLDVGCGRGELVEHALHLGGFDAFGCDLVPELCDERRIFQADITLGLPFGTRQFDFVSCLDMVEHLPEAAVPAAIDELFRVANALVFITTNDRQSTYEGMELHLTRRPIGWWTSLIERAGWTVEVNPKGPPHADWQFTSRRL